MNNMYDWEGDEDEFEHQAKLIRRRLEEYREDQPGLVVTAKHLWAYIGALLVGAVLLYAVAFLRGM